MDTDTPIPLVILGVPFHPYTRQQTIDRCVEHVKKRTSGYMATPDLDFVMRAGQDPELSRILAQAALLIPDGWPIIWLSGRLGPKLPAPVTGSDLILSLSEAAAQEGFSVFHLGVPPGISEKAGEVLKQKFPGYILAGCCSPPETDLLEMDHIPILHQLEQSKPDILYVALGSPKQEKWINLHFREWEIPLAVGLGDSFEVLAGIRKRVPKRKRCAESFRFILDALKKIKAVRRLECTPRPAELPSDAEGNPDARFVRIPWIPLQTPEAAQDYICDTEKAIQHQHAVLDFTGTTWLTSLELGTLLILGRNAKFRRVFLLRTGTCDRLDTWLRINLMDPLIEPVDPATDWNTRLSERPVSQVTVGSGNQPKAVPATFGSPKVRKKILQDNEKKSCTLFPPEELSALTLDEWRQAILPVIEDLPSETKSIFVEAGDLRFLDSAGLGFFMLLKKRAKEKNQRFEILNLQGAPLTTVKLARVDKLLLPQTGTLPKKI